MSTKEWIIEKEIYNEPKEGGKLTKSVFYVEESFPNESRSIVGDREK